MADSAGINTAVARVEHHDAFGAFFFAAGLLCPLDVFNGCCSFALACEAIPESVIAASPAFSTWRREASIFNGLKVLIRPELQTSGVNVISYRLFRYDHSK
jgi:hypothetical protein